MEFNVVFNQWYIVECSGRKLQIACDLQKTTDTQWKKVRSVVGKPAFVAIRVSSSKVYCTTPANQTPQLNLELMSVTGSLYESKTGRITLKIKNNGKEYNSLVPGPYLMNLY